MQSRTFVRVNTLPQDFLARAERVLERAAGLDLPSLNEANTKALLIEPMLAALGWDVNDLTAVTREYKVYDSTFLDYALLVDAKAVLFCEAKPTGKKLTDPKWVSQTVNYANNEGVVWCLLTDGLHWRVFKANEAVVMDKKLAFEVDLADVLDPAKRDRALRLFACLTPAAVAEGGLAALGTQVFVDGRVREALITLLEDPGKKLVDALRALTGTDLSPASIKAALSRVTPDAVSSLGLQDVLLVGAPVSTEGPAPFPVRAPEAASSAAAERAGKSPAKRLSPAGGNDWTGLPDILAGEAAEPAQLARMAGLRTGGPHQARTQLAAVVASGLLVDGELLRLRYKGTEHHARVHADGTVSVGERAAGLSLSQAALQVIGHGSWNGWDHWYVERDGRRTLLTRIRRQLAEQAPASP